MHKAKQKTLQSVKRLQRLRHSKGILMLCLPKFAPVDASFRKWFRLDVANRRECSFFNLLLWIFRWCFCRLHLVVSYWVVSENFWFCCSGFVEDDLKRWIGVTKPGIKTLWNISWFSRRCVVCRIDYKIGADSYCFKFSFLIKKGNAQNFVLFKIFLVFAPQSPPII